jgi:hypothetical protein
MNRSTTEPAAPNLSVRALYQAVRRGWFLTHKFGPRQLRFHCLELDRVLGAPAGDIAAR